METETQDNGTQETAASQESAPPDIGDTLASLDQKWDSRFSQLEERFPQPEPEVDRSLADLLTADDDLPDFDEIESQYGETPQAHEQEVDPVAAELATIRNYLIQQEEGNRVNGINALEQKYPDIHDHAREIADEVDRIADELGGDVPLTPRLVELAYKSVKADAASANETPAEEARKRGASLETEAGAGQASEESEDENIMRRIATARDSQSIF